MRTFGRWGNQQRAMEMTNGTTVYGGADITSIAVIACDDGAGGLALRMLDVGEGLIADAFEELGATTYGTPDVPAAIPGIEPTGETWITRMCYLDSAADLDFTVDLTGAVTTETGIPSLKYAAGWRYEFVDSLVLSGQYTYARNITEQTGAMLAFYKDLCVAPVPASLGEGYLVVCVRGRVLASFLAEKYGEDESDIEALTEHIVNHQTYGQAIIDIVCFYSTQPTLDGSTKGPFLLVNAMHALCDPYLRDMGMTCEVAFRCALGVPTAAFVGDDLYLVYVADGLGAELKAAWIGDSTGLADCLAAFQQGVGFREATVFRKFLGRTIYERVITNQPSPELDWTFGDELPSKGFSLPVRTWMAVEGSTSNEVRPLETVCLETAAAACSARLTRFDHTRTRVVDPHLLGGDDAHLLFALRPREVGTLETDQNLLFGTWRASVIPAGVTLMFKGAPIVTEDGRDVIVAAVDAATGRSRDQISISRTVGTSYASDEMDPAAVWVEDGEYWRIYFNNQTELVYKDADDERVRASWTAAWLPDDDAFPGPYFLPDLSDQRLSFP